MKDWLALIRDLILVALFFFVLVLVFKQQTKPDYSPIERKLDSLERIKDTLILKEKKITEKIKTNEVHYLYIRDSVALIPDSALQSAVITAIERHYYLYIPPPGEGSATNGGAVGLP